MFELHVEGMSCGGCANSVKRAVQTVDGNAKVDVELTTQKVRIETAADISAVTSAITKAGYPVKRDTALQ